MHQGCSKNAEDKVHEMRDLNPRCKCGTPLTSLFSGGQSSLSRLRLLYRKTLLPAPELCVFHCRHLRDAGEGAVRGRDMSSSLEPTSQRTRRGFASIVEIAAGPQISINQASWACFVAFV